MKSKLSKNQKRKFVKVYTEHGERYKIVAEVRYDDECGNGHNTFAITADIYEKARSGNYVYYSGGCQHEAVAKHFPELKPYIKYHLMSSDGPMHYLANTLYHAGDKDYNGLKKGEPYTFHDKTAILFDNVPIHHLQFKSSFIEFIKKTPPDKLELVKVTHPKEPETYSENYTFLGLPEDWYKAPFKDRNEAKDYLHAFKQCQITYKTVHTAWGKGKERELDAARETAIWPEATDEQLCAENLKDLLITRLPQLLNNFKTAMEELGFIF